jgi:hypothetical protein
MFFSFFYFMLNVINMNIEDEEDKMERALTERGC